MFDVKGRRSPYLQLQYGLSSIGRLRIVLLFLILAISISQHSDPSLGHQPTLNPKPIYTALMSGVGKVCPSSFLRVGEGACAMAKALPMDWLRTWDFCSALHFNA